MNSYLWLRYGAVVAGHDAVVRLADAGRPAALPGALVLLGRAHVRGSPGGGTAEAALTVVGGRNGQVSTAAAQRRGRVGVRGAPRARQRVDTDAVG